MLRRCRRGMDGWRHSNRRWPRGVSCHPTSSSQWRCHRIHPHRHRMATLVTMDTLPLCRHPAESFKVGGCTLHVDSRSCDDQVPLAVNGQARVGAQAMVPDFNQPMETKTKKKKKKLIPWNAQDDEGRRNDLDVDGSRSFCSDQRVLFDALKQRGVAYILGMTKVNKLH